MTAVWITVGGLCVVTAAIKASGPVTFGGRELPRVVARVIPLLAAALLTALVITETFGEGSHRGLVLDARAGGLVVAAIALALRAPLAVVVLCAAAATAVLRALGV